MNEKHVRFEKIQSRGKEKLKMRYLLAGKVFLVLLTFSMAGGSVIATVHFSSCYVLIYILK
jgi:hypothetical protein